MIWTGFGRQVIGSPKSSPKKISNLFSSGAKNRRMPISRVQALQSFGVPNPADVAHVERTLRFSLALEPAAIRRKAANLKRLFHTVDLPVPPSFRRLEPRQQEALRMIAQAVRTLNVPYRLQCNPFGNVFERLIMRTPAYEPLRPYHERWGGPFNLLQPDKTDQYFAFLPGMEAVPRLAGGGMYPLDIRTREDFYREVPEGSPWDQDMRMVFSRNAAGAIEATPYSSAFRRWFSPAANLIDGAADELGEGDPLSAYLRTVSWALLTNDFPATDRAWVGLKEGPVDIQIGAVETYMDGVRKWLAQVGGVLLLKDEAGTAKISELRSHFSLFEESLPVDAIYKRPPGQRQAPSVFMGDALFTGGDDDAGEMLYVAFNRPDDPAVVREGGRKIIIMRNRLLGRDLNNPASKYVTREVIDPRQRHLVTERGLTYSVVFHELAHGNGVDFVVGHPDRPAKKALGTLGGTLEELRADIVGLHNAKVAADHKLISKELLQEIYVAFVQHLVMRLRRGAKEDHDRGSLVALNWLVENGAVSIDPRNGRTEIHLEKMPEKVAELSRKLLMIKGDGNAGEAERLYARYGTVIPEPLQTVYKAMEALPLDVRMPYAFADQLA